MHPVVAQELLREDHMEQLRSVCRIAQPMPAQRAEELTRAAGDIEILITSWGCAPIDADVLSRLPRLRLIAHLAGSVKGFICPDAWARGVQVTNAVAANAVPVAEYTVAAIVFANKGIFRLQNAYRETRQNGAPWTREAPNAGNYRKTVGLIGASSVGRKVLELLEPYDLDTLVYDPYVAPEEATALGTTSVDLPTLLRRSDVLSLHAPLLPETRAMIGAAELAMLRDGATVINTARGGLIDQQALVQELERGRLDAVLDTTVPEVLPADSPLYTLPNVVLTPHIAGSLGHEVERLTDFIVAEVTRFANGQALAHEVRWEDLPHRA